MEANRLNQLLQENPDYIEDLSNDVFNHFTENTWLFKVDKISGFNNLEKSFREDVVLFDKDPSILQGALQTVSNSFLDDYKRRGGESIQLFNNTESINTKEFFDRLKGAIKEQITYYNDPKHQNSLFTKYYVDNIQPQNQTALAKTLNNIDQDDKTIELADRTQKERIASRTDSQSLDRQLETAKKTGYVQGVCECVAVVGDDHALGKKLLSEMNVTKDMARKFAKPETYKFLEQGIFAPQQKLEQTHSIKR